MNRTNLIETMRMEVENLARRHDDDHPDAVKMQLNRIQSTLDEIRSTFGKPRLSPEVWADIACDDFALADALALYYTTREAAVELARRTGCPPSMLNWSNQPRVFWSKIVADYANGQVVNGIETLKREGFEPPPAPVKRLSKVDLAAIDELSAIYSDGDGARTMLQRTGFAMNQIPAFTTPSSFWTQIITNASNGGVSLRSILIQASRYFPGNREITRLLGLC